MSQIKCRATEAVDFAASLVNGIVEEGIQYPVVIWIEDGSCVRVISKHEVNITLSSKRPEVSRG